MYYEVGGHEGYNVALFPEEAMSDYYLRFPGQKSVTTFTTDKDIMITKEKKKIVLEDEKLRLNMGLFANDALIFDDAAGKTVELYSKGAGRVLTVSFDDFKYLGVWTKPLLQDTNYVCIEPWSSLPDCNYLGYDLTERQDIRRLDAGKHETLSYSITIA